LTPSISRDEGKLLGRRAERLTPAPDEWLAIWVPGRLRNPTNTRQGWKAVWRYSVEWKERTAQAILEAGAGGPRRARDIIPLRITFHAHTHNALDSDGLQASLKACRDALVECGVLSGDADKDGHEFLYTQQIDRARRGVEVRIRARASRLP
jgi:hypothetical protein